jgi:hypothetical protein
MRPSSTRFSTVRFTPFPPFSLLTFILHADGGANTIVYLCEKAKIDLESPIFFSAQNQTLTTATYLNDRRAKLTIANTESTTAVLGAYPGMDRCTLSNVIIDGARPALGWDPQGNALIEMGGSNVGQTIHNVKVCTPFFPSFLLPLPQLVLSLPALCPSLHSFPPFLFCLPSFF